MIRYCVLTSLINAVASLVLALAVYLRRPRTRPAVLFGWFALSVMVWSIPYFLWQTAADDLQALWYCRVLTAAAIVIPVAYYHCVTGLVGLAHRGILAAGYGAVAGFALLSFTPWLVSSVHPLAGFPHWPVPGALYSFYLLFFSAFVIGSLALLIHGYRRSRGLRRNQLRFVILGTSVGFFGGSTNFFLWYGVPVPPFGNGLVALYVVGVGYAIIRFRMMSFNLLLTRAAVYTLVAAIIGLTTPLGYGLVTGSWSGSMLLILFVVAFGTSAFLLWIVPIVRRRLDAFLEQRVLGARLPNRELLRQLGTRLSSAQGEPSLYIAAVTGISEALDVPDVAVYTRTEFETDFTRRASAVHTTGFPEKSPLAVALRDSGRSVLLDELEHSATGAKRDYFKELRRRQGIELAVPIVGDAFFYGFITLGARHGHVLYTENDLSLLEAIGLQIGLNLRARQLERRASQTEKLISLGTLAAGLAHELRNPLTSVQTFTALLSEGQPDAETLQEFGAVVQRDVNRIASIVDNVAAFAESNKVDMTAVRLGEVLRAVADIVRPELARTSVEFTMPETNACVRGNHSQLLQVFINLFQNAIQAMEGRPQRSLTIDIQERDGGSATALVCVTIADNGPGIDPALLPHVFEPFITTKATGERRGKHGMGLGLAIVKRIIQHHHGEIDVASTPGRGTTFRVHLPILT